MPSSNQARASNRASSATTRACRASRISSKKSSTGASASSATARRSTWLAPATRSSSTTCASAAAGQRNSRRSSTSFAPRRAETPMPLLTRKRPLLTAVLPQAEPQAPVPVAVAEPAPRAVRAYAVDALRGLAFLGVVLGEAKPYEVLPAWIYHAQEPPPTHEMNTDIAGLTFPDLVFPFFLFTMGVAIPLALTRRIEKGAGLGEILRRGVVTR